jgi:PAS domain S-box-containing protein
MYLWPRTIRWQMLLSLGLIEALSIVLFAFLLARRQHDLVAERTLKHLKNQASSLALQAQQALMNGRPDLGTLASQMEAASPSVSRAALTDPTGKPLFAGEPGSESQSVSRDELAQVVKIKSDAPYTFEFGKERLEGVRPIYVDSTLRGYAWVESDNIWGREEITSVLRASLVFGGCWILVSTILVWLVARRIARPLTLLHAGTRSLMSMPQGTGNFPLPVETKNEFGDLIVAFNRMVASIAEQRAGLSDTLSLLDSMLANAPVGLAFVDHNLRIVRVNQVFASLTGVPLSRHLGRTVSAIMPSEAAARLEEAFEKVFAKETLSIEIELDGEGPSPIGGWTWLVSVYPVLTGPEHVRWAGMIVRDVSERVRAEETLRKTEKLAATGRLAASIAHEINNPLEALTNILFLLRHFTDLDPQAHEYVAMAEHEVRRVAEIAQQTLRFYRQSTLPGRASLGELIDSVLDLYRGRLNNQSVTVERNFDPQLTLFCYSGEIRQVFANLFGNAIDAVSPGGRIIVRARPSRNWSHPESTGIRFTVADTGVGMVPGVRERIFEAFFTTKDAIGTGLGLWVSHEIIQKHRGLVRVRSHAAGSDAPSGTVFQIFLPDDEALGAPSQPPAGQIQKAEPRSSAREHVASDELELPAIEQVEKSEPNQLPLQS